MNKTKRLLSLLLAVVIVLGMIPAATASSYEDDISLLYSEAEITVTPCDAILALYDSNGKIIDCAMGSITPDDLISDAEYKITASRYGYVSQNYTFTAGEEESIDINLDEAEVNENIDESISAQWKNFRNSDVNMGITVSETPKSAGGTNLKWAKKIGSDWSSSPSVQIIADDSLIVMSGNLIYKLSLKTGEIIKTGTLASQPSYGYTPPTYAEGMIFTPLGDGCIQALNANTLESLWIYKDPLGGQAQTPITYSDGYIYTGFWDKETTKANYVCLSVTDEDINDTDESKEAVWRMTSLGGFYQAGSVVVGDAVIFGSDNGEGTSNAGAESTIYSLNKYTGKEISTLRVTGDQRCAISYSSEKERIYFTTKAGYIYSAALDEENGELSDLKGSKIASQSTSAPIVYGNKVYFTTGSGIYETGSAGNFVVADADTLEMLYAVGLKGYPQCSLLLSTAYEDAEGLLYFYSTYNMNPGGISLITVDPDEETSDGADVIEIYDASGYAAYCIASPICDEEGTIYYKNDSGYVFAVSSTTAWLENLSSSVGTGLEDFLPNVTDYELKVPQGTDSITLSLTPSDNSDIEITLNGSPISTEVSGENIISEFNIEAGNTATVTISVTCGNDVRVYNLSVRETSSDTSLKAVTSGSNNITSNTAPLSRTGNIFVLNSVEKNKNDRLWFTPSDPNASSEWTFIEGTNKSPGSVTSTNIYDKTAYKNRVYYSSFSGTTLASVKVTAENGIDSEIYYFVISDSDGESYNYASEISLDKNQITLDSENRSETLTPTVIKSVGTAETETLTWKSSNENAAAVSQDGVVTYVGEGSAEITVSGKLGAKASCEVTCSEGEDGKINVTIAAYDYNASAANLSGASSNGVIMERTLSIDEGTSASDAIKQAFSEAEISIDISESEYGAYVSSINGLTEGTGGGYSGWCLNYNNDDFSNYGLGFLTLKNNDRIELHYSVNPDGATDDIGNGWYGPPIITSFTLAERTTEMSKETVYDDNYNVVTNYYIHSQQGTKTKMLGDGTKDNPLIIPILLPSGTKLTNLTAVYSASLNEHYRITENLDGERDYTNGLVFSISSRGGLYKTYYKVKASVEASENGGSGNDGEDSDIVVSFRLIGSTKSNANIDLGTGGYNGAKYVTWIKTKTYTMPKNSTVYDLFKKALDSEGLKYFGADENYVKTIYAPDVLGGYALSEYENGKRSGWMYSVNGRHPQIGLKNKKLSDGDEVIWHYVNDYSYEIKDWFGDTDYPSAGDGTYYNKWLTAADVKPSKSVIDSGSSSSSSGKSPANVAPDTTIGSNGEVKVKLRASDISEAIKSINDGFADYILIEPDIKKTPASVRITLPKSSAKEITDSTDSSVIIKTEIGYVEISNGALSSITGQAKDDTIEIIITPKVLDEVKDIIDTSSLEGASVLDVSIKSGDTAITDLNGQSILISLPVSTKYFKYGENYKVTAINGEETESLISKCVYLDGKLFAEVSSSHPAVFVVIPSALGFPFDDLDGHWALESVRFAYQNNLMNGVSATKFEPDMLMTRAMLVTVLYRMENSPAVADDSAFCDLETDSWYEDAVIWAYDCGIINGYSETTFAPFESITREQMAAILMRYSNYKGYKTAKLAKLEPIEDANEISEWAKTAMQWTYAEGLITGKTSSLLNPQGFASRGEVATMLMRFCENIVK